MKFRSDKLYVSDTSRAKNRDGKTVTYVTEAVCDEETSRTRALLAALLREICKA